jgi:hypothetical protein
MLELLRIPVGRAEKQNDEVAALQSSPVHFDVGREAPAGVLSGAIETQKLSQRRLHQRWCPFQESPLLGMPEQSEETVAEQIARRLMAGEEQCAALRKQLVLGSDLPRALRLYEQTHETIGDGRGPLEQAAEILGHRGEARLSAAREVHGWSGITNEERDIVRPSDEIILATGIDAEHIDHHESGERTSEIADEIDPSSAIDAIQEAIHDRLDARRHRFQRGWLEGLGQHLTQAGVVPTFQKEQRPTEDALEFAQLVSRARPAAVYPSACPLRGEARIAQHIHDVRVIGEEPSAATKILAPMDRRGGAQRAVDRVRIAQESCIEHGLLASPLRQHRARHLGIRRSSERSGDELTGVDQTVEIDAGLDSKATQ